MKHPRTPAILLATKLYRIILRHQTGFPLNVGANDDREWVV